MARPLIKLLVVEDQTAIRHHLVGLLHTVADFAVIGEAENGHEALDKCYWLRPDVVLLEPTLPVIDGFGVTRTIKQHWPAMHVIMLFAQPDPQQAMLAMDLGASNAISRRVPLESLAEAIRVAFSGSTGPAVKALITAAAAEVPAVMGSTGIIQSHLRTGTAEVLDLVNEGYSNEQIAEILEVSLTEINEVTTRMLSQMLLQGATADAAPLLRNLRHTRQAAATQRAAPAQLAPEPDRALGRYSQRAYSPVPFHEPITH